MFVNVSVCATFVCKSHRQLLICKFLCYLLCYWIWRFYYSKCVLLDVFTCVDTGQPKAEVYQLFWVAERTSKLIHIGVFFKHHYILTLREYCNFMFWISVWKENNSGNSSAIWALWFTYAVEAVTAHFMTVQMPCWYHLWSKIRYGSFCKMGVQKHIF